MEYLSIPQAHIGRFMLDAFKYHRFVLLLATLPVRLQHQERGERRGVARKVRMKQIDVEEVAAMNRAQAEEAAAAAAAQAAAAAAHEAQPAAARCAATG